MHRRALAVALAVLPCVLRAQSPGGPSREPLRGSALLADQQPWAGAQVELWSRPLPGDDRFGDPDVVRAVSDAKGRFRVDLLPGRRYTAWASERLDAGGFRVSHPLDEVRPGRPLDLIADEPRPPGTVRIAGLDPWRTLGAIECRLLSNTTTLIVATCPEKDGQLQLPPFPGRQAGLEILCGGQPLRAWADELDLTRKTAHELRVPPPRPVRFQFTDAATGRPIAGASFTSGTFGQHDVVKDLAQSDTDGIAVPLLPISAEREFAWVNWPALLQARGYAPQSWIDRLTVPMDHDAKAGPPVASIAMQPGREVHSRLCLDGAPCGGVALRLQSDVTSAGSPHGSWHQVSWVVGTDAEGRFRADVDPRSVGVLTAVLDEATAAGLAQKAGRFPLNPQVLLAVVPPDQPAPLPREIDLAKLVLLDVQVKSPEGVPADSPLVGLIFVTGDLPTPLLTAATDRSGRIRLLVPAAQEFWLSAWSEEGFAVKPVPRADAAVRPVELSLQRVKAVTGVVQDSSGKPVPWAQVTWIVSAYGDEVALVTRCMGHSIVVRTDSKGAFTLPLYPTARYRVSTVRTPDDTHHLNAPQFTAGEDEPEYVRIAIGAVK